MTAPITEEQRELLAEVRRLRALVESYEAASLEQHLFGDP